MRNNLVSFVSVAVASYIAAKNITLRLEGNPVYSFLDWSAQNITTPSFKYPMTSPQTQFVLPVAFVQQLGLSGLVLRDNPVTSLGDVARVMRRMPLARLDLSGTALPEISFEDLDLLWRYFHPTLSYLNFSRSPLAQIALGFDFTTFPLLRGIDLSFSSIVRVPPSLWTVDRVFGPGVVDVNVRGCVITSIDEQFVNIGIIPSFPLQLVPTLSEFNLPDTRLSEVPAFLCEMLKATDKLIYMDWGAASMKPQADFTCFRHKFEFRNAENPEGPTPGDRIWRRSRNFLALKGSDIARFPVEMFANITVSSIHVVQLTVNKFSTLEDTRDALTTTTGTATSAATTSGAVAGGGGSGTSLLWCSQLTTYAGFTLQLDHNPFTPESFPGIVQCLSLLACGAKSPNSLGRVRMSLAGNNFTMSAPLMDQIRRHFADVARVHFYRGHLVDVSYVPANISCTASAAPQQPPLSSSRRTSSSSSSSPALYPPHPVRTIINPPEPAKRRLACRGDGADNKVYRLQPPAAATAAADKQSSSLLVTFAPDAFDEAYYTDAVRFPGMALEEYSECRATVVAPPGHGLAIQVVSDFNMGLLHQEISDGTEAFDPGKE